MYIMYYIGFTAVKSSLFGKTNYHWGFLRKYFQFQLRKIKGKKFSQYVKKREHLLNFLDNSITVFTSYVKNWALHRFTSQYLNSRDFCGISTKSFKNSMILSIMYFIIRNYSILNYNLPLWGAYALSHFKTVFWN